MSNSTFLAGFLLLSFSAFAQPGFNGNGNGNGNGGGNGNNSDGTDLVTLAGPVSFEATLGDKVSLYDNRLDQTGMYGFGIAPSTLYSKTNGSYAWLRRTNFQGDMTSSGIADASIMHLKSGTGGTRLTLRDEAPSTSDGPGFSLVDGGNNWTVASRVIASTTAINPSALSFEHNGVARLVIDKQGAVGIGTTTFETATGIQYKLSVNGKVRAKEIVVETGWADFVFEEDYDLRPLSEVEAFIAAHGHLPEIPSAKCVESEGLSVGEMQTRMMMKIEELTLYLIDLKSENEALKADVERLKAEH